MGLCFLSLAAEEEEDLCLGSGLPSLAEEKNWCLRLDLLAMAEEEGDWCLGLGLLSLAEEEEEDWCLGSGLLSLAEEEEEDWCLGSGLLSLAEEKEDWCLRSSLLSPVAEEEENWCLGKNGVVNFQGQCMADQHTQWSPSFSCELYTEILREGAFPFRCGVVAAVDKTTSREV